MTLRTKTLLIITATLVGLIALLYASSKHILMGSFADLERALLPAPRAARQPNPQEEPPP